MSISKKKKRGKNGIGPRDVDEVFNSWKGLDGGACLGGVDVSLEAQRLDFEPKAPPEIFVRYRGLVLARNTRGDRGRLSRQDDRSRNRRPSSLRAPGVDEPDGGPQGLRRSLRGVLSNREVYWEDEIDLTCVFRWGGWWRLRGGRHRQDNLHGRFGGNARSRLTVLFGPSLGNHGFEILLAEVEEVELLFFFRKNRS
ncbi:hypothetical protein GUJ93_ZPchr0014g47012 [Zizania palustris]|uniref:Uncharacterized protein n=1 Tax=Zizania palustris TaxID=103762 RepID=A0A8J5VSH7_ZIZPA|nr:hypothetical protein GUJ93_ZPchr0014g47012 [Zizania palustris]